MENNIMDHDQKRIVNLPASKSVGARFLVVSFFSGTLPTDPIFDDCDDLRLLQEALLNIYTDEEPIDYGQTLLDVASSGTALRFVTAVCASVPDADFVITGTPRLNERPMKHLVDVLKKAGALVEPQGKEGGGPYRVKGTRISGGDFEITADVSSQFISALMLVAPTWKQGIRLKFLNTVRSRPYIEMTARVMEEFGVKPDLKEDHVIVAPSRYKDNEKFKVEADWSAASYFFEAAVCGAQEITIPDLTSPENSIQGDRRIATIMKQFGLESTFNPEGAILRPGKCEITHLELDFIDNPDLVPSVAVTCVEKGVSFRFTGVASLRDKESDRINSLTEEFAKRGVTLVSGDDFILWDGERKPFMEQPVDPHGDHRLAMAFAFCAYSAGKIEILHPEVVEKSFINFWQQLPATGLQSNLSDNIMTVSR